MSQPFDAWSFCRDVLVNGTLVEQDTQRSGRSYEAHSARLDANAREFADRLKPHLALEVVNGLVIHHTRKGQDTVPAGAAPIDMVLPCPRCGMLHIDIADPASGWTNPPHRSHLCHQCGFIWRPADVPTNGVSEAMTKGERDTPAEPVTEERLRALGLTGDEFRLATGSADDAGPHLCFGFVPIAGDETPRAWIQYRHRLNQWKTELANVPIPFPPDLAAVFRLCAALGVHLPVAPSK